MTNFLGDARQRTAEEHATDSTGLGPNFSGSLNDLWRMVFRPSQAFLRYVKLAVSNDDGSPVAEKTEGLLADVLTKLGELETSLAPLAAVKVDGVALVGGKTVRVGPLGIPGVVPAVAYTANDAFGEQHRIDVPKSGIIQSIRFFDKDDEGLNMTLLLFREQPAAETDNAALSISDADLSKIEVSILIDSWHDLIDNQVGAEDNLGIAYTTNPATPGQLWAQWVSRGGPTIAAANSPMWEMIILADE